MKLRFHILIKVFHSTQIFMQKCVLNQKPNIFLDDIQHLKWNGYHINRILSCQVHPIR